VNISTGMEVFRVYDPDMPTDQPDVAAVAALIAEPARARMLLALSGNEALSASTLAAEAGLSAPATSAHLRKLLAAGLIVVTRAGRCRYYRVANRDVVAALETLARLAPTHPSTSLRQSNRNRALYFARICYDHLAGRLAVRIVDGLIARRALTALATPAACLGDAVWTSGPAARPVLAELGVSLEHAGHQTVPLHPCLDWSVGRPHLAGTVGSKLLQAMLDQGWLTKRPHHRAVQLTTTGAEALRATLGIEIDNTAAPAGPRFDLGAGEYSDAATSQRAALDEFL
jgi:DNA-binding transcriptional ArsR family regulator